jgi:cell pole-organizing protein PopZ
MTQPAKVQEPSMEEILASIRRIIADDEAKPPAAEKPAAAAVPAKPEKPAPAAAVAKAPVTNDVQPSATRAAPAAAPKPAPPSVKPAPAAVAPPPAPAPPASPPAAPAASNNQDDIDALLNGLDEATSPEEIRQPLPDAEVFDLTDEMAVAPPEPPQPSFQKFEPEDDVEFAETVAAKPPHRQPAFEPPPLVNSSPAQQILSRSTVSAVESAFNTLANTVLSNNARTLEDLVKEMLRPMLKSWLDDNLPGLVERIVKAEIDRVSRGGR